MLLPIIKLIYNISITGHTRYKAAKRLGMGKIPCIIADDFSKQKVKEFRIADNKVAESSKCDMEKFKEEFEIVIKYKDEKQYKKRLKSSKKVVGYDCVSCR